jgi:hypothetical protein
VLPSSSSIESWERFVGVEPREDEGERVRKGEPRDRGLVSSMARSSWWRWSLAAASYRSMRSHRKAAKFSPPWWCGSLSTEGMGVAWVWEAMLLMCWWV